jgi:Kef-type K+ transport system membrane component KefB
LRRNSQNDNVSEMKPTALYYLVLLTLFGFGILTVLHFGRNLPPPAAATETVSTIGNANTLHAGEPSSALSGMARNLKDPVSRLFLQLLIIIVTARLVGRAFVLCGQPSVVGEMAAGILLGPSFFGLVWPTAFHFVFPDASAGTLRLLSQIGVCLFMFTVGMELDVAHVRNRAQMAVVVSHASIVVPYFLGVGLAWFLYTSLAAPGATFTAFALFMGISMSITAFPVLARILQERNLTKTFLGSMAVTCAAVDDVTAWCVLALVVAIARASSVAGSAISLFFVLAFIALMVFGFRRVLPRWLGVRDECDPSTGSLAIVVCLVVASALTTEIIGIHAIFGSFLAGAIMPQAGGFRHKLSLRIENFSSVLLLPLFFVFTGLRTQVGLLGDLQGWLLCLLILAVATSGKLGGTAISARVMGMSWRDALQLGALMNTRGLMELIALNIGFDLGILSPRIFTMLVIMALATTMLTGPLLSFFGKLRSAPQATTQEESRIESRAIRP